MNIEQLLDEHFGTNNGAAILAVLQSNPDALAEWLTETRIVRPASVWQLSYPAQRSHSRHGPASISSFQYVFDDPETVPLEGEQRFAKQARLYFVGGAK